MLLKLITILPSLTNYKKIGNTLNIQPLLSVQIRPWENIFSLSRLIKMKPNNEIHTLYVPLKRQPLIKLPTGKPF